MRDPELQTDPRHEIDFDDYADQYQDEVRRSISFIGQEVDFFTETKARWLMALAERHVGPLSTLRVLDVGCGVGLTDRYLIGHVGSLEGVDTSAESVRRAARSVPRARYQAYDGGTLPYESGRFDLVFAICVFHHVPPAERPSLAREMARVLRPGGVAAIFEHNPWNPLTRLAVDRCEFDADAILLRRGESARLLTGAGLAMAQQDFIIFAPFRSRLVASAERLLGWLPLGAQYFVAGRKPDAR